MSAARLIGLDWGTSSLRAYFLGAEGSILEQRDSPLGIMRVQNGDFAGAFAQTCGDWLRTHPQAPVLLAGMIGSKQGWTEAPYCACPADAAAIAAALAPLPLSGRSAHIVPGLSCANAAGVPDVMRGEETQIIGALSAAGSHLAVLPGTHSKWAWVEQGAVVRFASYMTGEIYAALSGHTILGRMMQADAPHDPAAFVRGVRYGLEAPQELMSRVFSARTLGLFGQLSEAALPSYLSGLLIGSEIAGAAGATPHADAITILGNAALTQRYVEAFAIAGMATAAGPADCAALGLWRIAKSAGLLA
ncbi:MAG: putative 2-keto-3-deoxy-galactonokinase [Betaproteobacteria bacterium]|nr:putative 2-keto-3-deoxy-galactonokinase [Betaproteobacteria bacterium]